MTSGKDLTTRHNDAKWASDWSAELRERLPCNIGSGEGDQERERAAQRLGGLWRSASQPVRRSIAGGLQQNPKTISDQLHEPLQLPADPAAAAPAGGAGAAAADTGASSTASPFDEISEEAYEAAAEEHFAAGSAPQDAPLNPQQRAGGRTFLRLAVLRRQMQEQGATPAQIDAAVRHEGIAPATLVIGAGGTGKSAMVHQLKCEFSRLGLGRLLVTAYTGVAAAPFGGPTLLSLLNMSLEKKAAKHVREASPAMRAAARKKFEEECGAPPEEFGGMVVDEVSFLDLSVFGHLDKDCRTLFGREADGVVAGGLPLLFCGDNHQKPPPCGTPWYRWMVRAAMEEAATMREVSEGARSAVARGLNLLKSTKKVELTRLMRARTDQPFIEHQLRMRRTDVRYPISREFLSGLRTVSAADLRADAAWMFAPVGVLSHVERDSINHAQLIAFARAFNLPIIRWQLKLADGDGFQDSSLLEQLYAHEPNLWHYFVEGAPVHLTETIKSVRKLVNGSPGLLDSLNVTNAADRRRICDAYAAGFQQDADGAAVMVTLDKAPQSVNVVVGGTDASPRLWHEVPLDDLTGLIPLSADGAQVVPVLCSGNEEEVDCFSFFGAQQGIAQKLKVKMHQYSLAFALTDFKVPYTGSNPRFRRLWHRVRGIVPDGWSGLVSGAAPGAHAAQADPQRLQAAAAALDDARVVLRARLARTRDGGAATPAVRRSGTGCCERAGARRAAPRVGARL